MRPSKSGDVAPAWDGDGSAGSPGGVCQPEGKGKKGKGTEKREKEQKKEKGNRKKRKGKAKG